MQARGIPPKAIIEGPPKRQCPLLLRQTSFKALQESVSFKVANDTQDNTKNNANNHTDEQYEQGEHTARFGEIEQRGVALTHKGRTLYDTLLNKARDQLGATPNESNAAEYYRILEQIFAEFPDDYEELHSAGLAYFYYQPVDEAEMVEISDSDLTAPEAKNVLINLIEKGIIRIEPIVYEDFLPVSAAGIFQSNLQQEQQSRYDGSSSQQAFERDLGVNVYDELALYESVQADSLKKCLSSLQNMA